MIKLKIDDKIINLYFKNENKSNTLPLVVLNNFADDGRSIWEECMKIGCEDFILMNISNINWNDEMTPWYCPPISKGDTECQGKADEYLEVLCDKIIPKVEKTIEKDIKFIALSGYSLAGLFALYSAYNSNVFTRIASASGSFWYPDFFEYVKENRINDNIDKIYFSLGDKESQANLKFVETVMDNTQKISEHLAKDIEIKFEINKGDHFHNATNRMAKAIKWIVD